MSCKYTMCILSKNILKLLHICLKFSMNIQVLWPFTSAPLWPLTSFSSRWIRSTSWIRGTRWWCKLAWTKCSLPSHHLRPPQVLLSEQVCPQHCCGQAHTWGHQESQGGKAVTGQTCQTEGWFKHSHVHRVRAISIWTVTLFVVLPLCTTTMQLNQTIKM